jgi:hypothetical protein
VQGRRFSGWDFEPRTPKYETELLPHELPLSLWERDYEPIRIWKASFVTYLYFSSLRVSRDSSVGIATVYRLDNQAGGSSSPDKVKNFHFSISSRPALGSTQPPIKWVPGIKRQGREADHSPPTSAEVKKLWIYTSTSPYVFMA